MKHICHSLYFLSLLLFGCQSIVTPPAEFPTIDAARELHIFLDPGPTSEDYVRFKRVLEDVFYELEYPGELIFHKDTAKIVGDGPQMEIRIEEWSAGYSCGLQVSLSNESAKTHLGLIYGHYTPPSFGSSARRQGYEGAAKIAAGSLFVRLLPYTNLDR